MAFRDTFEAFAKTAYDKTGEAVEYTKLNAKILSEKSDIKNDYKKLGEYIYNSYKNSKALDDTALSFCHSIDNHNKLIEKYQKELNRTKANSTDSKSKNTSSTSETIVVSTVVNTTKDEVEMTASEPTNTETTTTEITTS
ncbi:MAG: hypothetical protein IJN92_11210 [Lachnospiraceae bacterium]|nr:hypothetical protein [Lachnospiraceae bacterium]